MRQQRAHLHPGILLMILWSLASAVGPLGCSQDADAGLDIGYEMKKHIGEGGSLQCQETWKSLHGLGKASPASGFPGNVTHLWCHPRKAMRTTMKLSTSKNTSSHWTAPCSEAKEGKGKSQFGPPILNSWRRKLPAEESSGSQAGGQDVGVGQVLRSS